MFAKTLIPQWIPGPSFASKSLRDWCCFLACLTVTTASLSSVIRIDGLAWLLGLIVVTQRPIVSARTLLLATAIVLVQILRKSGHWYAAHAIVDFIVVVTSAIAALLSLPESLKERLSSLSANRVALFGVAVPMFVFQMNTNPLTSTGDT